MDEKKVLFSVRTDKVDTLVAASGLLKYTGTDEVISTSGIKINWACSVDPSHIGEAVTESDGKFKMKAPLSYVNQLVEFSFKLKGKQFIRKLMVAQSGDWSNK